MLLDQADGIAEFFRGYLPYYLLVALPIFIIMSPVNPVEGSHEFSGYRMQQFDLHSVPHGVTIGTAKAFASIFTDILQLISLKSCRNAAFQLEGRSLTSWSTPRQCVVARLQDISIDQFMELRSKAGALLLVLPRNVTTLNEEERQHIQLLESAMAQTDTPAPVYFVEWSPEADTIVDDLKGSFVTDEKTGTALEAMINSASANGYQIVASPPAPHVIDSKPVSIFGRLAGRGPAQETIIVATHYDASAIAPSLACGADSGASGVAVLMELARIFSGLYASPSTRGEPSIMFLLAGAGQRLNYFSAKRWLEEQMDSPDSVSLQDVSFVMCLDSLSSSSDLIMHVSKPPKAGTAAANFQARLGAPAQHKKINLAHDSLAWQHERFSIRRLSAFTVSALKSHKEPIRNSLLDRPSEEAASRLVGNTQRIAEALAAYVYNLTPAQDTETQPEPFYTDAINVEEVSIRSWYNYLSSSPRSAEVTTAGSGTAATLQRILSRYVPDARSITHTTDKREPEYTLYAPIAATLFVYSVKPAVFDLILTLAIAVYLTLVYFAIQLFPSFYEEIAKYSSNSANGKAKVQ